jgi:citrate synthase
MDILKERFQQKAAIGYAELKEIKQQYGDLKASDVTLDQIFGGMRGVKSMIWETSELDPQDGIRFRGYSIDQLKELLPRSKDGGTQPLPEGIFWLMLTGDIPTDEEVRFVSEQWNRRSAIPEYVFRAIETLPLTTHPMTQFITALSALQNESIFARRYSEGMNKNEYWNATYEDSMNLIAKLPRIAAYIYRRTYHNGDHIKPDISNDWAANFAHMLGINKPDFTRLMRLYLTIHADHEGGNGSAHTTFLVGSTLADPYLSFTAAMCALAGPLHGLANQEVIKWIFNMIDVLGTRTPTKEQIAEYVQATLAGGRVVPGYGHAVLRRPDPRFIAQMQFAQQYIKNSDIVEVVWKIYEVVPGMLEATGKVKNPWPNVDAHSGALLVHYGMEEYSFYTVMFGVSRALGVLASLCWCRAFGFPLERPKSVTMEWVRNFIKSQEQKKA